MIGKRILHYEILEELGRGGMGVVYRARDEKLQRDVALKFLPQHLRGQETEEARFLQEARAASALNHPHVCVIHDISEEDGQRFIVMEWVEGQTLGAIVRGQGPAPLDKVTDWAIQIGEALAEAHAHGVIHRDIKDENIMVNAKGQVKVMDFGLAKLKGSVKLTQTSTTVGTLGYMAPEQIQTGVCDARTDVFSFGVVIYELVTGRLPFRGDREAVMMYSILNEEPDPLATVRPEVSAELVHVVDRALEKNPEERYQSVADMLIDLKRLKRDTAKVSRKSLGAMPTVEGKGQGGPAAGPASDQPPGAAPAANAGSNAFAERPPAPGRGRRVAVAITVALAIALAAGAWRWQTQGGPALNPNMSFKRLDVPFTQLGYPGFSPDGNWISFCAPDERGKWDVYFMSLQSGGPRRVTSDSASYINSTDVSPDGSQIAYSERVAADSGEIRIVPSLGGAARVVASYGFRQNGGEPRWRPDGRRIAWTLNEFDRSFDNLGKRQVWSVAPDGSDPRKEFTDSVGIGRGSFSLSWSPDGRSLAWIRSLSQEHQEMVVRDLDTGRERQLTHDRARIDEVCWTRRNEIFFSSTRGGSTNIWAVRPTGGRPVQVTKGTGPDIGMQVSADGRRMVFIQLSADDMLNVADLETGKVVPVNLRAGQIVDPTLSPDGRRIAFTQGDPDPLNSRFQIVTVSVQGGAVTPVSPAGALSEYPQWSPDGRYISYYTRAVGQSPDSTRLKIAPADGGNPVDVGLALDNRWVGVDSLMVSYPAYNEVVSPRGGRGTHIEGDSLAVIPTGKGFNVVSDLHAHRVGMYLDPHPVGVRPGPRSGWIRIQDEHSHARFVGFVPDYTRALVSVHQKLYWVDLPGLAMHEIRGDFPGLFTRGSGHLSGQSRLFAYSVGRRRSQMVLVEDLH